MYPFYISDRNFDRKCMALYEDDIHGIAQLYGDKPQFKTGRKCKNGTSPDQPTRVPGFRPQPTHPTHPQRRQPETQTYKPDTRHWRPDRRQETPAPDRKPNYRNTPRTNQPEYKPRYEPTNRNDESTNRNEDPDKCLTKIDAIANLRGELMVFMGKYLFRFIKDSNSNKVNQSVGKISYMWRDLANYDHIDAVFEMKNGNFAFFIGRKIYIYAGTKLVGTSDLTHYGFDDKLKRVDAIFRWSHNNNTFVFSGKNYWR